MISAILLAAGESRRMGEFKQLLGFHDKTFVEHCVDNLLAARLDEVVVVTGHRESEVRAALGDRPVRFVKNPQYRSGMSSSIKSGFLALSEGTKACVLALVDQPHIGTEVIDSLIETHETSNSLVTIPRYEGKNGHPIVLDLSLKEEILSMDPAKGLRQVVAANRGRIVHVEVSNGAVLEDFDLPEDYKRLVGR
ncbi:MAG: nucleotidyltransferase family protein [Blastocatellia bacterium]